MKLSLGLIGLVVLGLNVTTCSSTPVRGVDGSNEKQLAKQVAGKTPKEAVAVLGQPISAFWSRDDRSDYVIVYPRTQESLTAMQFMMKKSELECTLFHFEEENKYTFKDWTTYGTCEAFRDKKLDTSLIE